MFYKLKWAGDMTRACVYNMHYLYPGETFEVGQSGLSINDLLALIIATKL